MDARSKKKLNTKIEHLLSHRSLTTNRLALAEACRAGIKLKKAEASNETDPEKRLQIEKDVQQLEQYAESFNPTPPPTPPPVDRLLQTCRLFVRTERQRAEYALEQKQREEKEAKAAEERRRNRGWFAKAGIIAGWSLLALALGPVALAVGAVALVLWIVYWILYYIVAIFGGVL